MSAPPTETAITSRENALVDLEANLIGWQLKDAPGVRTVIASELRGQAQSFQAPFNRIQEAIFREIDAQRTVSVSTIHASLHDNAALAEVGGIELLQSMAFRSPSIVSDADGHKQAMEAINAWRKLQSPLTRAGDVELTRADTVTPVNVDWIWPGWLAAGKFHLIAGSPGTGKTTLCLSLAATITSGGAFPCGSPSSLGSVLMWSGEDDLADSIVPRFMACGGDRSRLHFIAGVKGENGETIPFDPAYDFERLALAASRITDLRLLILDPVVSAVAGDSHKNSETRRGLQPLVDFAAQMGAAVLGVSHFSKGTAGRDTLERFTGSHAFGAVARLAMGTAKPKDPTDSWRLVRAKSNIGPSGGGFEYDLTRVSIGGDGDVFGQAVNWGDALDGTPEALLAEVEAPDADPDAPSREAAEEWLQGILGKGQVRATYIERKAQEAGLSIRTVRRAKKQLGVQSINAGKDGWWWYLHQMATNEPDGQAQNGGHVATLPDGQGNCVAIYPDSVATLSNSEVVQ